MIDAQKLSKIFEQDGQTIAALNEVSFQLPVGQSLAISGSSGAGKSTLLSLLGGLDRPSSGEVHIEGQNLFAMSEKQESVFRNRNLGFVFQFHHLLKDFTIFENVFMPLWIQKQKQKQGRDAVLDILDKVGLSDKIKRYPQELSGGEQQRAALARALVHRPKIILADEPTGNLDESNGGRVFELLCGLNRDLGSTLVVVTHHRDFAKNLERQLVLHQGRLESFS